MAKEQKGRNGRYAEQGRVGEDEVREREGRGWSVSALPGVGGGGRGGVGGGGGGGGGRGEGGWFNKGKQ